MPSLRAIVEDCDTLTGKAFDIVIQLLIVVSVFTFAMESLPNLKPSTYRTLRWIEVFTVAAFTLEYGLRWLVAEKKLKFVVSPFGIIDLLAILPFYLSLGIDLRSLRMFRMVRLVRLLKLARYSKAVRRFHQALLISKEEIVLFLCMTAILLFIASAGIYHFEHEAQPEAFASVFHSMWWAVTTLTTVGYGDTYPVTPGGKVFTFLVLIVGLGVVSIPAGLVASALTKAREMED